MREQGRERRKRGRSCRVDLTAIPPPSGPDRALEKDRRQAYLPTFTRYALITAAVAMLMIVTIVIAIRRLNKKGARAPEVTSETDCAEDLQNTVYVNLPMLKNRQSKEENQCEGATAELIYATVDFSTNRNSNTQQQVDSHDDDTGVIYSTVCRDQILNHSYIKPQQQQYAVLQ